MLELLHHLSSTWEAISPSAPTVIFELTAENDGTLLHLTQAGIGEGEDWEHYRCEAIRERETVSRNMY